MKARRILICEDDPFLALDMAARVERMGHVALGPVANASDALDLADAGPVDAALVDINPADGRSGLALAREMYGRAVPICVCSAGVLAPTELRDMRHVFVRKPFDGNARETCIDGILHRAGAAAA